MILKMHTIERPFSSNESFYLHKFLRAVADLGLMSQKTYHYKIPVELVDEFDIYSAYDDYYDYDDYEEINWDENGNRNQ